MQIVESMEIGKMRNENNDGLQKVENVVFCKNCGMQHNKGELKEKLNEDGMKCPVCNGEKFITGEFASVLAGYLKLHNEGTLKKYYKNNFRRNSIIKMNNKRIVHWLLLRNGFYTWSDKDMERVIEKVMWKKS